MNKSFVEWLDYYENATKEDVIQDMMLDINSIKEKNKEIERLNKEIESWIKLINYNEIEDIPQYIEDLEVDNKSLKKENKEINKENKRLNSIINELERRFNQELENNEKYDIEDTKEFYSKKWVRDTLSDFINMIKELKGSDKVE